MSWAAPSDVIDRWIGNDAPTDNDLLTALIADAEAIILSKYPGIQARLDDGLLNEATVIMVVCRMVSRVLRNPEGLTYWQQQSGPFGQARNYGSASQDMWPTSEELALLAPKKTGKAFEVNISPGTPYYAAPDDIVWRTI